LPVVTVPAGKSNEGLPIGVQIVGTPFAEEMVLAAAEIVEAAFPQLPIQSAIYNPRLWKGDSTMDPVTTTLGFSVLRIHRDRACL
jgi:hypothetical protein